MTVEIAWGGCVLQWTRRGSCRVAGTVTHKAHGGAPAPGVHLLSRDSNLSDIPTPPPQGFVSIKETKNARRILDQHTSTLYVGSKISLQGLQTQELNEKKGTVTGPAVNNRVGIQLEEGNQRVSKQIINIRDQEGPLNTLLQPGGQGPSRNNTLKGRTADTDPNDGEQTYQYGTHAFQPWNGPMALFKTLRDICKFRVSIMFFNVTSLTSA